MQKVIGVRFRKAGKIHYFNPGQAEIKKGDFVIIETQRGLECLEVVISPREIASEKFKIENIRRKANAYDLAIIEENHEKEKEAFAICQNKISEHKLPMNLIGAEYTFDMNKIIFSFTADGRVDFRELVKDLAAVFHTRIELHQVGVRDEAKLMGGIGCCGRPLCCASFLGDFIPVSIRMAKEQNLSLNPTKISGICGRLMCCLKFENDYYCEQCSNVTYREPQMGERVVIDEGEGKVVSINNQNHTATILLDNAKTVTAAFENIFEAENVVNEIKTIVATVSEDEEVGISKNDYKPKTEDSKTERSSYHMRKTPIRSNNLNTKKYNSVSTKLDSTSTNKPDYRSSRSKSGFSAQPKSNYSTQAKSDNFSQSKSDHSPRERADFSSTNSSGAKTNYQSRDRDSRGKDNRKFSKRDKRSEEYKRNKKYNPRYHDIDSED